MQWQPKPKVSQRVFTVGGVRFCSPFSVPAPTAILPSVSPWQRRHGFAVEAGRGEYKEYGKLAAAAFKRLCAIASGSTEHGCSDEDVATAELAVAAAGEVVMTAPAPRSWRAATSGRDSGGPSARRATPFAVDS